MKTLVIADDVDVSRKLLSLSLSRHGYRVLEADDGDEALRIMQAERPDLAIVDLLMPTMDGFEFAHAVRKDSTIAQTPVIFFSSTFAVDDVAGLSRSLGVRHVLQKNSSCEQILEAIRDAETAPIVPMASITLEEFRREHSRLITEKFVHHSGSFVAALGEFVRSNVPQPADSTYTS